MRRDPLSAENQRVLGEYQLEGLVQDGFQPQGETDREKRRSIESRAYVNWLVQNQERCGNRPVETCRSMFQMRRDPSWSPPQLEMPIAIPPQPPPATGFAGSAAALPRGDAWEGPDPLFPEPADVPPPMEA